jgi:uncharacterized membrane protein YdfJ with MMPL/SSD domain
MAWLAGRAWQHRWAFVAVWAAVLVAAAVAAGQTQSVLKVGGYSLPGTEFNAASTILTNDLGISSDKNAVVVFHSDNLRVSELLFASDVKSALARLGQDSHVVKTDSYYSSGVPDFVSGDNHTTYAYITMHGSEEELERLTPRLRALVRSPNVDAKVAGQAAANYDIEQATFEDLGQVERLAFPIIFILLLIVFRSLVAVAIPLLMGAVGVATSLAAIYLLAKTTDVSIFALNTASMIGLGLAIDFSLIVVSRYREELERVPPQQALENTLNTSGRSIASSGLTVMLTMSVLALYPVMIIRSIAEAIAIVAGVSVVTGLLLLPALLALIGPRINTLRIDGLLPWRRQASNGEGWYRWARFVMARPLASLLAGLLVLILLALPATRLHRVGVTVQVMPTASESRQAVETIQKAFGAGEASPIFVVIHDTAGIWQPDLLEGVFALDSHLRADPRVAHVQSIASLIPNPTAQWIQSLSKATIESNPDRLRVADRLANLKGDNKTMTLIVYPKQNETNPSTVALLLDLRASAKRWAPGLAPADVLVGGYPAEHYDFDKTVYDQFPLLLGLSLLMTFGILLLVFRSLLLPIKAIILNLASLVAAYGVLTFVFQFGYGDVLLGFKSIGAVLSYTPVLLFSILFGLSTDYEVFVLSRVRELVQGGVSNTEAVAQGLQRTAGVITAAGLILIAVFGSFAFTQVLVIKELGFALAVAVLIDMTVVRLVLVPATMRLLGGANWWLPYRLQRWVPELEPVPVELDVATRWEKAYDLRSRLSNPWLAAEERQRILDRISRLISQPS